MVEIDLYMKFIPEVPGQGVGCIDAPVLAAGAAKADLEAFEAPFDKVFDGDVHKVVNAVEEFGHPRLLFEEILYRLVAAGERLEFGDASRVEDAAAIEYKSAAIAA